MKAFAVCREGDPIGEAVEFSNGHVVVRWFTGDTISRFPDLDALRTVLQSSCTFEPIRSEPLGIRLQRVRAKVGLSQRALSRETGVSFSTISRIESGRNHVSNPALEAWLEDH